MSVEVKPSARQLLLAIVALLFGLHGLKQPMALIVPMSVAVFLLRNSLRAASAVLPRSLAFVGLGMMFGLAVEVFAILENWHRPAAEKILMHPQPGVDLLFGAFSYGLTMLAWLPLVARWRFSLREVFIVTSVYGACVEQMGAIVAVAVASPWPGVPLLIIIGAVYGVFPTLAYLITESRFAPARPPSRFAHDLLALLALFGQWAFFGLVVLPGLKALLRAAA